MATFKKKSVVTDSVTTRRGNPKQGQNSPKYLQIAQNSLLGIPWVPIEALGILGAGAPMDPIGRQQPTRNCCIRPYRAL